MSMTRRLRAAAPPVVTPFNQATQLGQDCALPINLWLDNFGAFTWRYKYDGPGALIRIVNVGGVDTLQLELYANQPQGSALISPVATTSITSGEVVSAGPMLFGAGIDGDLTVSSPIALTRDASYRNLTLTGTGSIATNGWRLFVSGTLDLSLAAAGAIYPGAFGQNGGAAAGVGPGVAGAVPPQFTLPRALVGSVGGTGNTGAGIAPGVAAGGAQGAGGQGGNGGAGGSGIAGAVAAGPLILMQSPIPVTSFVSHGGAANMYQLLWPGLGGGGGGQGAGDGTHAGGGGGGGGAGGATIGIWAHTIIRRITTPPGIITTQPGRGGNGGASAAATASGGGGGGGGGGGHIYIVCDRRLGGTTVGALDVSGGAGGSGGAGAGTGSGGNGGDGGKGGLAELLVLREGFYGVSAFNVSFGTAGQAHVGTVGGAGGAGAVVRMDL